MSASLLPTSMLEAHSFIERWLNGENWFEVLTSGSTGAPKKIKLHRTQLIASAINTGSATDMQPGDAMHVVIKTEHIGGLMQLVRAIHFQMETYIYKPHVRVVEELIYIQKRNHCSLVVPMLEFAMSSSKGVDKLKNLTSLLIGGGFLHANSSAGFKGFTNLIFQTYGMTETCSNIAFRNMRFSEDAYFLLPGWQAAADQENCLSFCHETITGGWLQTNDLGKIRDDGGIELLGRKDFVINAGGKKYIPEVLEKKLQDAFYLNDRQFFVSSIADDIWGETPVLVIGAHFSDNDKMEVLRNANQVLGEKVLRAIYTVKEFPQTSGGKIDRMALKKVLY